MRLQAERYAKAKNVTIKVKEVRVTQKSQNYIQVINSVLLDRKQRAAWVAHQKQVFKRKTKARTHNDNVVGRLNRVTCQYENSMETKMERLKTKIRQAAAKRGSQLLQVRQTAEKLRKPRITDATPVSFEIEVEKSGSNQVSPIQ